MANDGETFYHISPNPDRLMAEGARADLVGTGAGIQAGRGFYLSRAEDIEFWGQRVSGWTLTVTLPATVRLLASGNLDAADWAAWMVERGYMSLDDDGRHTYLPALKEATGIDADEVSRSQDVLLAWQLNNTTIALYAEVHGYDGVDFGDQVVITNYALLSARAFAWTPDTANIEEELRP